MPTKHLPFTALLFLALLLPLPALAVEGDPMVKITSLPISQDPATVMAAMSKDVSRDTGLSETFVTYYWQTFDAIHCPGCEGANIRKPIFVDLYTPAFMSADERKQVMNAIADAIARHTDYTRKEIFMHTHIGDKDQLFIGGSTVTNWKQVGGPDE